MKVEDKICKFCYYEFPYDLSLEEKGAENLRVKFNELSEKILASKNSSEEVEPRKRRMLRRGLRSLIFFITTEILYSVARFKKTIFQEGVHGAERPAMDEAW